MSIPSGIDPALYEHTVVAMARRVLASAQHLPPNASPAALATHVGSLRQALQQLLDLHDPPSGSPQ